MTNTGALLILRQHPLFAAVAIDLLAEIAEMSTHRRFPAGAQVFRQGEPGEVLYGVISGRIRISAASEDGRELNLNVIEPGEIIGEIAFLDDGVRTASGVAIEPTTCFALQRAPFLDLLERRSELAVHLLKLICQRFRFINKQVTDSAFLTVPVRLAQRLAQLPRTLEAETHDANNTFEVRISQTDLASFLGVSRQVINGYLRDWQRQGAVRLGRGRVAVTCLRTLMSLAGQTRS